MTDLKEQEQRAEELLKIDILERVRALVLTDPVAKAVELYAALYPELDAALHVTHDVDNARLLTGLCDELLHYIDSKLPEMEEVRA